MFSAWQSASQHVTDTASELVSHSNSILDNSNRLKEYELGVFHVSF